MKHDAKDKNSQHLFNWEAEQATLGALILRSQYFPEINSFLQPRDFTQPENIKIFEAMCRLHHLGDPIDLTTVIMQLKGNGSGVDPVYVSDLSEHTALASHAVHYARKVKEAADRREMLATIAKISDAIQTGGDALELIKKLQSFTLPDPRLNISTAVIPAKDFQGLELADRENYLHPWLSQASLNMVYGDRGIGKTQFAMSLCDALTRGENFGPWTGCGHSINCLYLDGELPAQDTRQRLLDLTGEGEGPGWLFIYSDSYANSLGLHRANLTSEEWRNAMKELLLQLQVKVFVIDNIASLAPGIDENSKQEWDPINQWFLELRFADITVIFLHHTSKEGKQRGTGAREDNIDISILLDWPQNYEIGEGARFVVKFKKARVLQQYVHLLSETEFVLQKNELDKWVWTWGSVKEERIKTFLDLYSKNKKQTEIAEIMGVDRSTVTRIKQKAIRLGYITEKGEITQSGDALIL